MPEFQGRLLPVGDVFSAEGVALAVKRPGPNLPHPLLRLLTLSLAEASRKDYAAFQAWARPRFFDALSELRGGAEVEAKQIFSVGMTQCGAAEPYLSRVPARRLTPNGSATPATTAAAARVTRSSAANSRCARRARTSRR